MPPGLNLTEWELKNDNGVISQLERLSHFTYSVYPSSSALVKTPMILYQRPTIPFKLECESRGLTRDKVYGYFSGNNPLGGLKIYEADLKGYGWSVGVLIVALIWPTQGAKGEKAFFAMWVIFNTAMAGMLIYPTITAWNLWGRFASMIS